MPAAPAAPPPTSAPSTPSPAAAPAPAARTPFEESFADMERYSDEGDVQVQPPPAAPKTAPKPAKPPVSQTKPLAQKPAPTEPSAPPAGEEVQPPEGAAEVKPPEEEGKPGEVKPGRDNPWKLLDHVKQEKRQLQRRVEELEQAKDSGELPKQHQERFTQLESRNKELEEEIRFVNYKKSKDFVDNFQKPYEEAWGRALGELKELTISQEDGTAREASARDLLTLANMPLKQAWETAKQWFGDAASEIMAHRRNLRELSDKQEKALESARKTSSERETKLMEEHKARAKANAEETSKLWNEINSSFVEKHDFLRPVEGETERNQLLEKATKFVDDTFSLNLNQAKTAEERAQMVKQHAALRARAIGFSTLKHENKALRTKVDELTKALSEFQGSEPTGGDPRSTGGGELQPDTLDGAVAALAKLAS